MIAENPFPEVRAQWRALTVVLTAMLLGSAGSSGACDLCAIYTATEQRESRTGLRVGIAEQFTSYNTLQLSGEEIPNPEGQRLESWITQVLFGYNFTPRLGLQLNVPVIDRSFRRPSAEGIDGGNVSGFGDLSLVGNATIFSDVTEQSVMRLSVVGGVKLPSGNSSRIAEELVETPTGEGVALGRAARAASRFRPRHGGVEHGDEEVMSGIHGHDLALGSGSTDGVIGGQAFASWQRMYLSGVVQYLLRTKGAFDYTYANDLIWAGGPGMFLLLGHEYSLGVQAVISGESKGNDNLAGVPATDTAITSVYVGPGFSYTWGTSLGAEFAVDLPVVENNSDLQVVPDVRLRAGMTWRF